MEMDCIIIKQVENIMVNGFKIKNKDKESCNILIKTFIKVIG